MVKTITGRLPWSDREEWRLPSSDNHRLERWFVDGTGDVDTAIATLLPHVSGTRTCIQAGGCVGVWALRMAQVFDDVFTIEPDADNFDCLAYNTEAEANIHRLHHALWRVSEGLVSLMLDDGEAGNPGAYYVKQGGGDITTLAIDDLRLSHVDLIYLDIEGAETVALVGALETIKRCRPVIGIEDKGLWNRYGVQGPVELLQGFGYRVAGRPSNADVIMVPA